MATEPAAALPAPGTAIPGDVSPALTAIRRQTHKTIAAVSNDLDQFRFNRAVARIRELTNALDDLPDADSGAGAILREGLEITALLLGPMMPHFAEELWQTLGHTTWIAEAKWPVADAALARDDQVTIAVQVNGKLRATLDLPRDTAKDTIEAAALGLPQITRLLDGKPPRKIVVVPNRIVNLVA
jgi:leucyl-tRNA synthetase